MKRLINTLLFSMLSCGLMTAQSYYVVKQSIAGQTSTRPYGILGIIGNKMLYRTKLPNSSNYQLWVTDGTSANTEKLMDGYVDLYYSPPIKADGKVFFYIQPQESGGPVGSIYSYNGTTLELIAEDAPTDMVWFQDKLFYLKNTVIFDSMALYHATGVPDEPQLVKAFGYGNMHGLTVYNDELIIMAGQNDRIHLFHSDGTTTGTASILELGKQSNVSRPANFLHHNGKLYFSYQSNGNPVPPVGFYKKDGTAAGTIRLDDLHITQNYDFYVQDFDPQFIWKNDTLFAAAYRPDHPGSELWIFDSTNDSTHFVADIDSVFSNFDSGSVPHRFVEYNGYIYFCADKANNQPAIFRTDGTAAGTEQFLADMFAGPSSQYGEWLTVYDGKLAFRGRTQSDGGYSQLWFSDGTEAGTYKATTLYNGSDYSPFYLTPMGGLLLYGAWGDLWAYNNGTVPTILGSPSDVACNDNNTPSNPTDDYLTFDLNPTQIALSGNYTLSVANGQPSPAGGAFGQTTSFTLPLGSAGNGDIELTLTDAVNTGFSSVMTVADPGSCSTVPFLDASYVNDICNDNGTLSEAADDYISVDILAEAFNLGSGYTVSSSVGNVQPGSGIYGEYSTFALENGSAGGGDVTLTITDMVDASYQVTFTVPDPGTCSDLPSVLATLISVACDDNQTPVDPTDDIIVFELEVNGLNTSSSFVLSSTAGVPAPPTGLYGDVATFSLPPGSAGSGAAGLTIIDLDVPNAGTQILVPDPGVCSTTATGEESKPATMFAVGPNPFDETVVCAIVGEQALTGLKLEINNVLGRNVATVPFEADGTANWQAGNILAGLYFCYVKHPATGHVIYQSLLIKR
ncbi:MAG: hypothetical protein H6577_24135 [Lewinellaceae bacterium]|nr:hypothetical protein [Saprospiraceae bacterium]MCB9341225.1 hypothetical protein [Lewinellaceae bacterium]